MILKYLDFKHWKDKVKIKCVENFKFQKFNLNILNGLDCKRKSYRFH